MDKYDEIKYKNCLISIYYDEDAESSREWDNLGTMVGYCKNYKLYDKKLTTAGNTGSLKNDFIEYLNDQDLNLDDIIYLPVYAYIHSGIGLSTDNSSYPFNCRWDSGQVGYIYVTTEKALKTYSYNGMTNKFVNVIKVDLINEIEVFNYYLSGNIFGFTIHNEHSDEIDSCWGFYGSPEDTAIPEAKSVIDNFRIHNSY